MKEIKEALEIYHKSIRNAGKIVILQEISIEQEIIEEEMEILGLFSPENYHESRYYMD